MCLISLLFIKSLNSCEVNCEPLLDTNFLGSPYYARMSLKAVMVHSEVVLLIRRTYGNFEWAPTTMSSILLLIGQESLHGLSLMTSVAMAMG